MDYQTKVFLFLGITLLLLILSRKPLRNPKCHGFYRFFAFEGILLLALLNLPFWFAQPTAPRQLASWLCLCGSVLCVGSGLHSLRAGGGQARRENSPENFAFENTELLVDSGIFRFIRHPMYSSLLLLAWGAFLKHIDPFTVIAVVFTSVMLLIVARIEERENRDFFGSAYRDYMLNTRKFIPFVY